MYGMYVWVCVCMYVCVCVCMCVCCMYVCMYVCMLYVCTSWFRLKIKKNLGRLLRSRYWWLDRENFTGFKKGHSGGVANLSIEKKQRRAHLVGVWTKQCFLSSLRTPGNHLETNFLFLNNMLLYAHCRLLSKNVWVPYAITHSKSVRLLFLTTFFFTIIDRTAATLIWLPTAIWLANKSSQDSGMMIIQSGSCAKYWRSFVVALNCNRSEQESRLLLPMRMYDQTCNCVMRSFRGNINKNCTTSPIPQP